MHFTDDQSAAGPANTLAGAGEGARAMSRLLHAIHCVLAR